MARRPLVALSGLFLCVCAITTVWIVIDRRPPEGDHANHLERAVDCYRKLRIVAALGIREILRASSFYPPVVTCAAGLLYLVFPIAPLTAQVVMMVFLAIALASIYGVGRSLFDTETGLWASLLFATAPFVVFSLTNFQLDLPLAAMVALAVYALVRSEDFARPRWSPALGLVCGLGMLTKPPFAIYVAPSLLWSLWRATRAPDHRRRLGWAGAALAIGTLLSLPWYGPRRFCLPLQLPRRSLHP